MCCVYSVHCAMCCNESHAIIMCAKFKALSVNERRDMVKQKSFCLLCLKNTPKHTAIEKMCPHCGKRHNGLLHFNDNEKCEKKYEKKSINKNHM